MELREAWGGKWNFPTHNFLAICFKARAKPPDTQAITSIEIEVSINGRMSRLKCFCQGSVSSIKDLFQTVRDMCYTFTLSHSRVKSIVVKRVCSKQVIPVCANRLASYGTRCLQCLSCQPEAETVELQFMESRSYKFISNTRVLHIRTSAAQKNVFIKHYTAKQIQADWEQSSGFLVSGFQLFRYEQSLLPLILLCFLIMASMICYSLLTTLKVNGRRFRHLLSWKKSASYA